MTRQEPFKEELRATVGPYFAKQWIDAAPQPLLAFLLHEEEEEDDGDRVAVTVLLEFATATYVEFVFPDDDTDTLLHIVPRACFQRSPEKAWHLALEANAGNRAAAIAAILLEAYHHHGDHITVDCGCALFLDALELR